ncbi:CDP-glycerol glycerophosphotransferase family protein [Vibrio fluvialis]|uniref:CDP-glycerol glycerophosphotransferase family protein n=1 Tax=Vibrio fluvialis TaxID=676 RepID=UPI001F308220|nr:CDP-glycerol glycerophosphotransferase family protein [Vibrio fluvialis]MCE7639650.1 CDP-glycerol glycerophosphotransferase family protein [Vibrio fluvialis]UPO64705.1 poly(glycerophosphate) glycerophosphotransferase [Vibrio fluvialis]
MKNKLLTFFLEFLFYFLNVITPKVKEKIIFSGYPDYDDMLKGILSNFEGKRIVVLVSDTSKDIPNWLLASELFDVVKKRSLLALYHILTASEVYYTHGLFDFFRPISKEKQFVVNLWHGMPLKNIGLLDGAVRVPRFHVCISSSEYFVDVMARSFGVSSSQVVVTGLPRNNVILGLMKKDEILEKLKTDRREFAVWLPTYRKTETGKRCDTSSNSILGVDNFNLTKIDKCLEGSDIVIFIKPHPLACYQQDDTKYQNIRIISDTYLASLGVSLYEMLGASKLLITDYSSVCIDYLVTKNKILSITADKNEYEKGRGFSVDIDDLDIAVPIENVDELVLELKCRLDCSLTINESLEEIPYNHDKVLGYRYQ